LDNANGARGLLQDAATYGVMFRRLVLRLNRTGRDEVEFLLDLGKTLGILTIGQHRRDDQG
jgi:hypothetical protein